MLDFQPRFVHPNRVKARLELALNRPIFMGTILITLLLVNDACTFVLDEYILYSSYPHVFVCFCVVFFFLI